MITYVSKYSPPTEAEIYRGRYGDGSIALQVVDMCGEVLSVATVNLEAYGEHPAQGNVFIKDWSENEGTLQCLVEEGVVSEPVRSVEAGFALAYECKLLGETVPLP